MSLTEQSLTLRPQVGLINRYAQKAKQVAITAINPIFEGYADAEADCRQLQALRIKVEGPPKSLQYFNRLIEGANLKI